MSITSSPGFSLSPGPLTLEALQHAATIINRRLQPTPTARVTVATSHGQLPVVMKLETMQPVGSFKARGTAYKFHQLFTHGHRGGVITMSAGNHAQGVAQNAQHYGVPAIVVMPEDTPQGKIEATEKWGAQIILAGETLAESQKIAHRMQAEEGLALIHPYDDPDIIIGQGTCGLELFNQAPDCTAVLIPIGGGGLAAGMALALKTLNPSIKLYGVQTTLYPGMKAAVEGTDFDTKTVTPTLAEGIAVKQPGILTQPIISQYFEAILTVSESIIENSVYELATHHKIIAEGAGAAAYGALVSNAALFQHETTALIITGGNIDTRIMASILLRGMVTHHKLMLLNIPIKDTPGQLATVATTIAACRGNIVKIDHQRLFHAATPKHIGIDVLIETRNHDHGQAILAALRKKGFQPRERPEALTC